MTAADALLAAIAAAPADDLPRLVYADYLDEHGDPDRAEFIRLQVQLARGPHDPAAADRANELLAAHKAAWDIPGIRGVQVFRRGFVESLHMAAEEFVAHADRIGRAAPVVELRLPLANDFLGAVAAVPWLPRVEALDLRANGGIGRQLPEFFARAALPRLRSLILQNTSLWPDDIDTLAAARLPSLESLNVSGNFLGDDGAARLAGPPFEGLTELILRCDMIAYTDAVHAAGAAALAGGWFRLRSLNLAGQYVGDAGLNALVSSSVASRLEELDVSNNDIGETRDDWADPLIDSPHLRHLKRLNLGGSQVSVLAAEALAWWRNLAAGTVIDLRGTNIPDPAYDRLVASRHADQILLDPPDGRRMTCLLVALLCAADTPKYAVKRTTAAPPDEVAAAVRDVLGKDCDTVTDAAGGVVAEVWFRADVPATATADQIKNGLTYREVPETTVLAAVRFPKAFTDYRKQEIAAGVYTLRLAFQPDTGDHTGTAPHTEFALLVPAGKDTSADVTEAKAMVKLSLGATGGDHPGVVLLFPHAARDDGPAVADRGDGVWTLNVRRPVTAGGEKGTLGFAITVAGHSKTR